MKTRPIVGLVGDIAREIADENFDRAREMIAEMSDEEKLKFDGHLLQVQHPLMWQAGPVDGRIWDHCSRMASQFNEWREKNKHTLGRPRDFQTERNP